MTRHEQDDDRGQYARWRDDDERQHRWREAGRDFDDERGSASRRFVAGSGRSGRQDKPDRAPERADWESRGRMWQDNDRDRDSRFQGDRSSQDDHGDERWGGAPSGRGWDWERNYGRTVDWSPRQGRERGDVDDDASWRHEGRTGSHWRGAPMSGWSRGSASGPSGPFVGRGPRGYRRSDDRIREDVCELLTRHGQIDATDVEVDVHQGEVTLRGWVDGRHTKRMIEDSIDDVPGVRDIHNEIRVHQGTSGFSGHTYTTGGASYQSMGEREHGMGRGMASSGFSGPGADQRSQVREGMSVVGSDGESVGEVKEVSSGSFLVNRPMHRDIFVPFSAIQSVSGSRVSLHLASSEVDQQGWATPDLMGANSGER